MLRSVVVACLVALLAPAAIADELTPLQEDFLREHAGAPVVVLRDSNFLEVRHDAELAGVAGKWIHEIEYRINDREGIEYVNRQFRINDRVLDLDDFRVQIIHANGKKSGLDEGDLEWIEYDANSGGVYTLDRRIDYAVIPKLGPGDRLTVRETYELRGAHGMPRMSYGDRARVPVLLAELEVQFDPRQELIFTWMGAQEDVSRIEEERIEKRKAITYRARLVGVPNERREPWAYDQLARGVAWISHFAKAEGLGESFAVGPDWNSVGRSYLDEIEYMLVPDEKIFDEAREVVSGSGSTQESIALLYEHVQRQCRYLGLFEGLGGLIPEPAASTAERRYGDCKGLSVLLISMLRAVEIEAWPVLLCAGNAGPYAESIPNMAQFNHFIVWADDGEGGTWLDPVYDYCPAGLVPSGNVRQPVLLLRPGSIGLTRIDVDSSPAGQIEQSITGTLHPDGSADLVFEESATGNAGLYRRLWLNEEEDAAAVLKGSVFGSELSAAPASFASNRDAAWDQPWQATLSLERTRLATTAAGEYYVPLSTVDLMRPSFDTEERHSNLHLGQWPSETTVWDLDIPAGLGLEPIRESRNSPGMTWSLEAAIIDGRLRLERAITFDVEILDPEDALELARALEEIEHIENIYLQLLPVTQ